MWFGTIRSQPGAFHAQGFYDEYVSHIRDKRCPAAVCPDLTGAPCQATCPIGTEAWRYIAHIYHGEYEKAYISLRETNPLPSMPGSVIIPANEVAAPDEAAEKPSPFAC